MEAQSPPQPTAVQAPLHLRNLDINVLLRGLLHEVRNPLSSILTASSLVQDSTGGQAQIDEETKMLLGVIEKESRRLNTILTEFANYIRLPEPSPVRFDIVAALRHLIAQNVRDETLGESIRIIEKLPDSCYVFADETQVRAALQHLLCNSAEAMPSSGTLELNLEQTKNHVHICLTDSGQGFNDESQDRAFQPFYSTKPYAVGLGLSAARAIIEAAGGHIWIDSEASDSDTPNAIPVSEPHAGRVCIELPLAKNADALISDTE